MAVPEQTPYIEHTGNGVATSFSLGFQCESKDHLIVLVDEIEPPIASWGLVDGNVVFTTAPAAGKKITAQRNTPFGRNADYQSFNNSFRPQTVNGDFDRIWWKLQELGIADWILGARIDALKNYVDRKDDELKAYLMEEIRKQGVALDQLDEYYNYLMERLAQIAVDKGWDASFVVSAGGSTQQQVNDRIGNTWYAKPLGYELNARVMLTNGDIVKSTEPNNTKNPNVDMTGWVNAEADQLAFNTVVSTQVDDLESYVVYAEKYGASLNEAMAAINTEFAGKRVRVYVPSDFPVTGTVSLNIDCDLSMTSLQVMNTIDVLFDPIAGWNGTASECEIFCNNNSINKGWNLFKSLGIVKINRDTFYDVGNTAANTSGDYFFAFHIWNHDIERLELYHPTLINSYVKPNGSTGDQNGVNRLIAIEGNFNSGQFASDINIFYPFAENLSKEEDSDGLVINCGEGTQANPVFNIDIYGGKFLKMHRRGIKIMGRATNATGIRLHGDSYISGAGVYPWCGVDISGVCHVEWNGNLVLEGFVQDFYVWGGAYVTGTLNIDCRKSDTQAIGGNSTRGFVVEDGITPNRKCFVDIGDVRVDKGYESMRIDGGQKVRLKKLTSEAIKRIWTISASDVDIGTVFLRFKASSAVTTLDNAMSTTTGASKVKIKEIGGSFDQTIQAGLYAFFFQNCQLLEIDKIDLSGNMRLTTIQLSTCSNTKIRNAKSTSQYLVTSNAGGANLLLSQCKPGSVGLFLNETASPLTNVVELNTLTF